MRWKIDPEEPDDPLDKMMGLAGGWTVSIRAAGDTLLTFEMMIQPTDPSLELNVKTGSKDEIQDRNPN